VVSVSKGALREWGSGAFAREVVQEGVDWRLGKGLTGGPHLSEKKKRKGEGRGATAG
jgi:hypothetical protein